jgi:hypothetical protein
MDAAVTSRSSLTSDVTARCTRVKTLTPRRMTNKLATLCLAADLDPVIISINDLYYLYYYCPFRQSHALDAIKILLYQNTQAYIRPPWTVVQPGVLGLWKFQLETNNFSRHSLHLLLDTPWIWRRLFYYGRLGAALIVFYVAWVLFQRLAARFVQ